MIQINPDFQKLIPPLSSEEKQQLENNLVADGCRDPLVLWGDTLIDGHNRFEICTRLNIPFQTISKEFESENAVKLWMIDNQRGRRNLTDGWRFQLVQAKKEILAEIGKAKKIETLKQNSDDAVLSTIDKTDDKPKHDTRAEIAKDLGWSTGKVGMADVVFKEAEKKPELKEKVLSGEVSINEAYKEIKDGKKKETYSEITKKIIENDIKPQSKNNQQTAKEFPINDGDVFLINGKHKLIVADANDIDFIKSHAGAIDCVLTDPPYGIAYKSPTGNGLTSRGDYDVIDNDDKDFNPDILFKYSDNVITWGGNHYANKLPNSPGWIVWDKRDGEQINNNSDCELAWTNMLNSARLFHHKWNGMIKDSEHGVKRIHATQKPIKLFVYCLEICRAGDVVLDLYAGSGVALIACEQTNRKAVLVEINKTCAAAMLKRFADDFNYSVEKI